MSDLKTRASYPTQSTVHSLVLYIIVVKLLLFDIMENGKLI